MKIMKHSLSRRNFIKKSTILGAGISVLPQILMGSNSSAISNGRIIFPRPFAFAVDDLGWNIGNNTGSIDKQSPYRIGIDRKMDINNYKPIIEVGEAVGTRIQSLFVLAEMDRENILKNYPTTTWQGENWDNSKNISDNQIEIMNFVKNQAAYMEFGLHGVGHEYWVDGKMKRAEWYSTWEDHSWSEKSMREHIQCFKDIMAQYGLSKENGHSFPESFVPCAYGYYWNPGEEYSTGKIMSEQGLKYVNTLFTYIEELNPPKGDNGGGFDNGVLVVNRINYGNPWYKLASLPTVLLEEQKSDIIETHWANWLAQDDFVQPDVTKSFVDYYKMVQKSEDRYIAKNTEQFSSQWLYKKYANVVEKTEGKVEIDNTKMPDDAYQNDILGNMVLKIKLKEGEHISNAKLNGKNIGVFFEDAGFGFIYLPQLKQKSYDLEYTLGNSFPDAYIYNNGTYNAYIFERINNIYKTKIRLYGTQDIVFKGIAKPNKISIDNKNITIIKEKYDAENNQLTLTLSARDMQGETGVIEIG